MSILSGSASVQSLSITQEGFAIAAQGLFNLLKNSGIKPMALNPKAHNSSDKISSILGQHYPPNPIQKAALRHDEQRMALLRSVVALQLNQQLLAIRVNKINWGFLSSVYDRVSACGSQEKFAVVIDFMSSLFESQKFELESHFFDTAYDHLFESTDFHVQLRLDNAVDVFSILLRPIEIPEPGYEVDMRTFKDFTPCFHQESDIPRLFHTYLYLLDLATYTSMESGRGTKPFRFFTTYPCLATNDGLINQNMPAVKVLSLWNLVFASPPSNYRQLQDFAQAISNLTSGVDETQAQTQEGA